MVILFCDTSALIKLFISEPGSDQMAESSLHAEAIAVCRITWAEAMSGMARRQRDDPISGDDIDQLGAKAFAGFLVRKDLVRKYSRQYPVATYVVEFLLGWSSPVKSGILSRSEIHVRGQ